MMQVEKMARTGQAVPLLAAFPFRITVDASAATMMAEPAGYTCSAKRDYSTCVEEESICPFFGKSKNDVKQDD